MRFIWINIFVINFIISSAFAQSELLDVPSKNPIACSIYQGLAAQEHDEDHIVKLGIMYAFGKICDQNYNESLKCQQTLSLRQSLPMYSLRPIFSPDAKLAKILIQKHNGLFEKEVFEFENSMINFLSPYSDGLGKNIISAANRTPKISDDNRAMLNYNGSASIDYCQLDTENSIPLLLYTHPPTKGNVVVVDVGSGWGTCAKQLALLGYKVYSIDIDQKHLDFQKDHFCTMPAPDTFVYQYWNVTNPKILDEHVFKQYCDKIKDNNIVYVAGNFADEKTIKKSLKSNGT